MSAFGGKADMTLCGNPLSRSLLGQTNEKRDNEMVDELSEKLIALGEKLGPEYVALMDGLEDIDPDSEDSQKIESVLLGLDRLCTR
jgi:hypothetical protein